MDALSEERPAGNTVPIPIVSAPTVNNVADEDEECAIVSDINDRVQCHDQLANKAMADLTVTALKEHHIPQSESCLRATQNTQLNT